MEKFDGIKVMNNYQKFLNTHHKNILKYNKLQKTLEALVFLAHSLEESGEKKDLADEKQKISTDIQKISLTMLGIKNQLIGAGTEHDVTQDDIEDILKAV